MPTVNDGGREIVPLSYKQELATLVIRAADCLGFLDGYSFLRGCLGRSRVAILMYHRVGDAHKHPWCLSPISTQGFRNQARYLCQKYEMMSLDKLTQYIQEKRSLPKKAVVITFDDGYKDNYLNAYPILKKCNIPATIFLTTGHIGTGDLFWWDKVGYVIQNTVLERFELDGLGMYPLQSIGDRLRAISTIERRLKQLSESEKNLLIEKLVTMSGVDIPPNLGNDLILSWNEVREMSDNGIAFGAHTVTHAILTKLSLEQAKKEIIKSKWSIEEKLNHAITTFAYPGGEPTDLNSDIKEILKESGFACAVTAAPPRLVNPGMDLYELGRIGVGESFDIFRLSLSGLWSDLKATLSRIRRR